jgi:hypothetical protein
MLCVLAFLPQTAITPALQSLLAVTIAFRRVCFPAVDASTTPPSAPTAPSLPGVVRLPLALALLCMTGSTFSLSLLLLLLLRFPPILALLLTPWLLLLLLLLVCVAFCNLGHCLRAFRPSGWSARPASLSGPRLGWPTLHLITWPTRALALLAPASAATRALATSPAISVTSG